MFFCRSRRRLRPCKLKSRKNQPTESLILGLEIQQQVWLVCVTGTGNATVRLSIEWQCQALRRLRDFESQWGALFLIFAEYKVFGTQFTLGGGFQYWINRFLQDGAYRSSGGFPIWNSRAAFLHIHDNCGTALGYKVSDQAAPAQVSRLGEQSNEGKLQRQRKEMSLSFARCFHRPPAV